MIIHKSQCQSLQVCRLNLEIHDLRLDSICLHVREWEIPQNYSFLRKKEKQKNIVYVIALEKYNYLQETRQNNYIFERRGNARRALASNL